MKTMVREWYPFPQIMPPKMDKYLVAFTTGGINIGYFEKTADGGHFNTHRAKVVAWMYMPDPYEQ